MLRRFLALVVLSIALAQLHCVGSDPPPAPSPTAPGSSGGADAGGPSTDTDASACAAKCDDDDPCTTDTAAAGSCEVCTHVATCAAQVPLAAVADSTLDESQPAVNTGGAATLEVAGTSKRKLALIRFDPSANGRTYGRIDRAVLHVTVSSASYGATAVAQLVKTPWSESVVSWSSGIQTEGSLRPLEDSTTNLYFDVTSWVQNWNANPASNLGIAITAGSGSMTIASHEDPANGPKLDLIVNAQSVSLPVVADTYVSQAATATNYGTLAQLAFSTDPAGAYSRVLAKYDLARLPAGATVFYAEAVFKILSGRLLTWLAYPVTAAWGEQTVAWKTTPAAETMATGTMYLGADGRSAVDVTSALVRWQSNALANNGLLLKNEREDGTGPSGVANAGSRESTTMEVRPTIVVLYK